MFRGSGVLFLCIFVVVVVATAYNEPKPITGPDQVTVYRLRKNGPGEILRDDHAEKLAANIEELIMARDYEREPVQKELYNFQEEFGNVSGTHLEDHCMENNGNCPHICKSVGQQAVCSCREGYTLTSTTTCSSNRHCDTIMSGTSGEFTIGDDDCQWLIKAPKHHVIKVTLHPTISYDPFEYDDPNTDFGDIYDGDSTKAKLMWYIRPITEEIEFTTTGPNLLIRSKDGWDYYSYELRISYVTGYKYFGTEVGKTNSQITVSSLSEGENCFSVTYSTPQNGYLSVRLDMSYYYKLIEPKLTFKVNDGKWKKDIFLFSVTSSDRTRERDSSEYQEDEEQTNVKFEFRGEGTKVYNLRKCINLEYYALGVKQPLGRETVCQNGGTWNNTTKLCTCPQGFVGTYCEEGRETVCQNGGTWNNTTKLCTCPQGFVGTYCEEGCGPNRYGENCSQLCSFLPSACEGMLFCTEETCSCAPGLQGQNCDSLCDSGKYGASCRQLCGKCNNDEPCDRYTGICYSGCSAGFYPPLCKKTYKVLMNAPEIIGVTYNSLKIRIPFENVTGEGKPVFYEVQYKEKEETFWAKYSPRKIKLDGTSDFEMMGLLPGRLYEIRVILIDKDGGSYQTDVPKSKAITKCIDPLKGDYAFSAKYIDGSGILLEWTYEHDKTSLTCEIEAFEISVHCGNEHLEFITTEKKGNKSLSDISPEMKYSFQLVGKTVTGQRTPAVEIEVHTPPAAPRRVRGVRVAPLAAGRQLNVTWLPPWNSEREQLRYKVTYQCIRLLACDSSSCSTSAGHTKVSTTWALLGHLQPHALYQVDVAAVSAGGLHSANYTVTAATADAAPHVTPSPAETTILAVTNTSVSINWRPPEDCSVLNGYIYGYSYSLVDNDTEEVIQQGGVPENVLSVNFSDLVPSHCYDAHITVVSSGGTSLSEELKIPFCTTSTAPDRVQSLSVYKKGRRMVGLRWSPPRNTYGDIESFTVTYTREGSGHGRKLVTEPKHCGAWPDLYCYTVSGLSPGKKYQFQVQTRNKDVSIDGEPAAVEAITSEGVSTPPVNLRIINSTENSMFVEWGMPDNINGQLRSFIIIVEQIDTQADSDECCDEIPLKDYRVTSEEPLYLYEITGLSAASTYSVTVSAKTVTLGEESRIIGHTYPPKASLPQNALVVVNTESSSYNPDVVTLQMYPAERISGVNRKYILLYLTHDSTTQQPLNDELATLIQSILTENYQLISEYTQEEIETQPVVTFDLKEMGFVSNEIQSHKYALILVQEYMGNRSTDIFIAEEGGD